MSTGHSDGATSATGGSGGWLKNVLEKRLSSSLHGSIGYSLTFHIYREFVILVLVKFSTYAYITLFQSNR